MPNLPEKPEPRVPVANQVPPHYRAVFTRACQDAVLSGMPVRLDETLELPNGSLEQYRGAFIRIGIRPNARTHLVYGAFSRRRVGRHVRGVSDRGPPRTFALNLGTIGVALLLAPM